jgi:hypothetical protein
MVNLLTNKKGFFFWADDFGGFPSTEWVVGSTWVDPLVDIPPVEKFTSFHGYNVGPPVVM